MKLTDNVKFAEQLCSYPVRMSLLKERLFEAMAEKNDMSKAQLSREVGVSRATVTDWLSGKTADLKGKNLTRAAAVLNVTGRWLSSGKGLKRPNVGPLVMRERPPALVNFRRIPVVSIVDAGEFGSAHDPFPVGFGDDDVVIDSVVYPVGPRAFALRIRGDSMRDEYLAGEIIVIDPDVEPLPREPVVAKRDEDGEATFKLYVPRGADDAGYPIIELQPLNPHFKTLIISRDHPGRIIGPMVTRIQGRRRH